MVADVIVRNVATISPDKKLCDAPKLTEKRGIVSSWLSVNLIRPRRLQLSTNLKMRCSSSSPLISSCYRRGAQSARISKLQAKIIELEARLAF